MKRSTLPVLFLMALSSAVGAQGSASAGAPQSSAPAATASKQLFTANASPTVDKVLAPRRVNYWPQDDAIVCIDGQNRFTRALYGPCNAFRLETSDQPEFGLYMPYMGGNLLIQVGHERCVASYDGASRDYQLTLPASCRLDASRPAEVLVSALALNVPGTVGAIWRISGRNVRPGLTAKVRYGAASNGSFSRNGDLGVDRPDCFDFTPDKCAGNEYQISGTTFSLSYGKGSKKGERHLTGHFSAGTHLALANATDSKGNAVPYLVAEVPLSESQPSLFALGLDPLPADLSHLLLASESAACQLLSDFNLSTPDPFINPLGFCLPAAANGIWDEESGVWQHGAIGWRMPLPGWRAGYVGDVLGWTTRARRHFEGYAASQLVDVKVDKSIPLLDPNTNYARATEKIGNPMYTTGYIGRYPNNPKKINHYDMNLVFIDELLWHLRWTGDLDAARQFWPTIQRHLDWEKRTFDPDGNGLYDAYCCIWASDGLYYSGGAVTHSSAYNLRANREAAEIAELLGLKSESRKYAAEANRIQRAIDDQLWLEDKGVWAECRDAQGLRRTHDYPALWTVYHAIDSEVGTPLQRFRATRYVDNYIPHIPVTIDGDDHGLLSASSMLDAPLYTLSTTSWQPYGWSINNVALAEEMHTALAYWQAGRPDEAFALFKGALVDGMYLGASPGNIGQISHYDAARGECYRDFGDPVGITARTLVQGLIGIQPDLLRGVLTIRPGFPSAWDGQEVEFQTPDFLLSRTYKGDSAVWSFEGQSDFFNRYDSIVFIAPSKSILAGELADSEGVCFIDADRQRSELLAQLDALALPLPKMYAEATGGIVRPLPGTALDPLFESIPTDYTAPDVFAQKKQSGAIKPLALKRNRKAELLVSEIFHQQYLKPRSNTVTLSMPTQGIGEWCHPKETFDIAPDLHLKAQFVSLWRNFPDRLSWKLPRQKASRLYLTLVGTTNPMQCRIANGRVRVRYTDGSVSELPLVNPVNWWPVEQELLQGLPSFYLRQYGQDVPPPYRMSLRTGKIYRPSPTKLNVSTDGGAATLLELPLDPQKTLKTLELECLSNDVIIGLIDAHIEP